MNPKKAWKIIKKRFVNFEPETITEVGNYFIFSIRPAGSEPGFSTGSSVILVDKTTGKLESTGIDDNRLYQGETLRIIDPSTR